MSTRSVIGEIRNGQVKAVYVHFDGYPSGVGLSIQMRLQEHEGGVEAFLSSLFTHGQWRYVGEPFADTYGELPGYTSLDQIAEDVWIEWAYLFSVDNGQFYVCDKHNNRNIVVCECPFAHIIQLDFDSMSGYEDVSEKSIVRRELPELTLTGTSEAHP